MSYWHHNMKECLPGTVFRVRYSALEFLLITHNYIPENHIVDIIK